MSKETTSAATSKKFAELDALRRRIAAADRIIEQRSALEKLRQRLAFDSVSTLIAAIQAAEIDDSALPDNLQKRIGKWLIEQIDDEIIALDKKMEAV